MTKVQSWIRFSIALIVGLAAIFFVPYLFAHPDGHSQSFRAHYNNHVALLLLLLCTVAIAWITDGLGLQYAQPNAEAGSGSRLPLYAIIALVESLLGVLWLLERRVGALSELTYFLDRYAMHDLGARLYRDIEFPYGPLFFWPQVWLTRLLHCSPGDAHFSLLLLHWPAGLALLWYLCRRLAVSRRDVLSLFLILSLGWLSAIVDGGLNYTPLRFLLAPALALSVYQLWHRQASRLLVIAVCIAAVLLLMLISPEQAVAFTFSTFVFFAYCVRDRRMRLPLVWFACACAVVFLVAKQAAVLNSLVSMGGGALDYPLLPSTRTIILLTGLILAGCLALRALRSNDMARPEIYLTLFCVALLPAAFGRSDTGHLFVNCLPLLAIVFCSLAATRSGYLSASGALLAFVLILGFWHVGGWGRFMVRRIQHRNDPPNVSTWPVEAKLIAPMGYAWEFERRTPRPVYTGRYSTYLPTFTNPGVLKDRLDDLRNNPEAAIILPTNLDDHCTLTEERRLLELKATLRPWYYPPAREHDQAADPLCAYIATHYQKSTYIAPAAGYDIYLPR